MIILRRLIEFPVIVGGVALLTLFGATLIVLSLIFRPRGISFSEMIDQL